LEPFTHDWLGWTLAEGVISEEDYARLCTSTDEVEIERLHQEAWLSASMVLATGTLPPGERRNLA
jgi:hypothetical protein